MLCYLLAMEPKRRGAKYRWSRSARLNLTAPTAHLGNWHWGFLTGGAGDSTDDDDSTLLGAADVATNQNRGPEGPDADETITDMSTRRTACQHEDLMNKAVRRATGASNANGRAK